MAVICGTPTPLITRVVQIDPGPIPTFTASAPAAIRSLAAFAGCHVSRDDVDFPSFLDLLGPSRSRSSNGRGPNRRPGRQLLSGSGFAPAPSRNTPTAAPTRSRPCRSLQAWGNRFIMSMSRIVIIPVRQYVSSTSSSFSTFLAVKICSASSSVTVPRGRHQVVLGHHLADRLAAVLQKPQIAAGQDADQLAAGIGDRERR